MLLEGYDVILNNNITYRFANGNDKDMEGEFIPEGYIVFIKLDNCEIKQIDGKSFYDCENSPIIPLYYFNSWYGIGESKKRSVKKPIEVQKQFVNEYQHSTMYFAYNGMVYTGSYNSIE